MKQKTSRTISFGQMRPKLKCLAIIYSFMLGPNHTHIFNRLMPTFSTVVERWALSLFCSHGTWARFSHLVDHELLRMPINTYKGS